VTDRSDSVIMVILSAMPMERSMDWNAAPRSTPYLVSMVSGRRPKVLNPYRSVPTMRPNQAIRK